MRKIKIYKENKVYVTGGIASIEPNGIEPEEEYEVENITEKEIEDIKDGRKRKRILRRAKKIK
jgi:F0F1-type ATP synthase epsilon subunit